MSIGLRSALGLFLVGSYFARAICAAEAPPPRQVAKPRVQGYATQRVTDCTRRGIVALPTAGNQVYVGWRLLASDPADVAFNVYRQANSGEARRLNAEPLRTTTDFVDASAPAGEHRYFVRAMAAGQEGPESESASAAPSREGREYLSIKLDGEHTFQKAGIADLDGDGRYDFVLKQPNSNVDPYEQYWKRSPGTYKLEAYRHDGTFLWRYDMGWAIEQGIWYSPYLVYDFDGDGRAEVAVKTGEGDPRDADGRVTSGPEYLSILDGRTGKPIARIDWPSREGFPNYNRYCRNQLGIAYLDGKTPFLLVQRGTYDTIKLYAYEFRGGALRLVWSWTDTEEAGKAYRGQGAHCLRAADIDGDGRDEVILGSAAIDDNGQGLWATRLGHPDHVYIGDLDPARPGLEIYYGIESRQQANGMCMVDAATGKILWGLQKPTRHVHSQGLCADIDGRYAGVECYSADTDAKKDFAFGLLHDARGKLIDDRGLNKFGPMAAYWDADAQRELLMGGGIEKYLGVKYPTRTGGSVIAVADILGDWREEILVSRPGELRIYTTTLRAADRRPCLMLDPVYRLDVAVGSQGYYQIPCLSKLPILAEAP